MRKVGTFIGLVLFAMSGSAFAQEAAPAEAGAGLPAPTAPAAAPAAATSLAGGKLTVGVDAAFQVPFGDLSDVTGVGFGGLARAEYNLIPRLNGTLRIGYIYSLKKDQAGVKLAVDNLPIWVGGKYFLNDMFYGAAEVGLNMVKWRAEMNAFGVSMDDSNTENKFGATVGVGALFGDFDAKAQLEVLNFGDTSKSLALMINVGYNFLKL